MQVDPQPGWGNYSLRGIEESFLPDSVSLLPETVGWVWLLGFAVLLLGIKGLKAWRHWKRNYYRRWALEQIDGLRQDLSNKGEVITKLPGLLKVTAINAYGRETTASLSGSRWLDFLDASFPESQDNDVFKGTLGELLLELSYKPQSKCRTDAKQASQLLDLADNWIRNHKEKGSHA